MMSHSSETNNLGDESNNDSGLDYAHSARSYRGHGTLLRDVQRAWSRCLGYRIASEGVTMGQWYFLKALWDGDGLTQRELSHRVGMMEPTTVTAVNAMERRGLVQRVRNPNDRRKMNVFLTDRGKALKGRLLPLEKQVNDLAIEGLSDEDQERLRSILETLQKNLTDSQTDDLAGDDGGDV